MLEQICVSSGKIFVPQYDKGFNVKIYKYKKRLGDDYENNFIEVGCVDVPIKNNFIVLSHGIACLGNDTTGLAAVFLIIYYACQKINIFLFKENGTKPHFFELCLFESFVNICDLLQGKFWLADGPNLTLISNKVLQIYSTSHNISKIYQIQELLEISGSLSTSIHFSCIDQQICLTKGLPLFTSALTVICSSAENQNAFVHFFLIIQDSKTHQFEDNLHSICPKNFFPSHYCPTVTAVQVKLWCNSKRQVDMRKSLKEYISQFPWIENYTVLCTAAKQCLMFSKGILKYCCRIPFPDISYIMTASLGIEKTYIILQSASKGICCIINKDNHIQCSQIWSNALKAFKGSIMENGSKQLLLLSDTGWKSWQNGCHIICLHSAQHSVPSGACRKQSDYLQNTLIGLQNRVIMGKAAVVEMQYKISEKQAATNEILRRLQSNCSGKTISTSQERTNSLVDILPIRDETILNNNKVESESQLALKILSHWSTVVAGQWVIGWTLENISESYVKYLKINFSIQHKPVELTQKLFRHPSEGAPRQPSLSDPSLEKADIKPSDMVSLVASIVVPTFFSEIINATCVMSWYVSTCCKGNELIFTSEEENHSVYQQLATKISISITDVMEKPNLIELPIIQQLMSFRVLQQCTVMIISSIYTDLSVFEAQLLSKEHSSCSPEMMTLMCQKYLFFNDEVSSLYGVSIKCKQLNKTTVEATAFIRDENQGVLLSQWMYKALPDDVIIIPKNLNVEEASNIRMKMLTAMKDEVDTLVTFLCSQHFSTQEMATENIDNSVSSINTHMQELKQHCKNDKIFVSQENYQNLRQDVLEKELFTDHIVTHLPKF